MLSVCHFDCDVVLNAHRTEYEQITHPISMSCARRENAYYVGWGHVSIHSGIFGDLSLEVSLVLLNNVRRLSGLQSGLDGTEHLDLHLLFAFSATPSEHSF